MNRPVPKNINRRPTKRRKLPGPSLLPVILFFGGIALVVLLVVGGGGFFVWKFFANRPPATETPIATTPAPLEPTADAIPTLTPSLPITPTESTTSTLSQESTPSFILRDDTLNRVMLEVINQDRRNNGLAPVAWDEQAAHVARLHADDMATHGFFNHRNRAGYGPPHRYNQIGGSESIQENLHKTTLLIDGQPAPVSDFVDLVRKGQESLMTSEGHKNNILSPAHTHVGAGFAHNPATGTFYLVQEFLNRYIALEPLPDKAQLNSTILIAGRILDPTITNVPIINLAYEPFPESLSVTHLNETAGAYISAGKYFKDVVIDGLAPDGSFKVNATLNNDGQKGLYSIRLFIRSQGPDVMANEWFVRVE